MGVVLTSLLLCGTQAAGETSFTAAQVQGFMTCAMLARSTVPVPLTAGLADRRAALAVQQDGGVEPAIEFLAGHNMGVPNTAEQRLAVALMRRWRTTAQVALRASSVTAFARDAGRRQELASRVALALPDMSGAPCGFPGTQIGPAVPELSLALAFERARLTPPARGVAMRREVTRLRAVIAAAHHHLPVTVRRRASLLADALAARGDRADPVGAQHAARVVSELTEPFLMKLLALTGAQLVAVRTPPAGLMRVPDVRSLPLERAYASLRTAGMHLVIPAPWVRGSLVGASSVAMQSPRPDTLMPGGTRVVVTLGAGAAGSPGVPTPIPTATVPALTGTPIADAEAAVDALGLYHLTTFATLTASAHAADLLSNYRVSGQDPAPGTVLALGVFKGGGFRPTPVRLWATLVKQRP